MTPKIIRWKNIKHHWEIYLFVLPTLILIGLFQYYPAGSGMFHSFYRWNGVDISEYIGWDNYRNILWSSPDFWNSFKVAFILGAWNIVKMIPALLVAVCIHRVASARMQFIYRILFVVPMVIPGLVIALVWRSFFFEPTSGFLNQFLNFTHLSNALVWLDQTLGWNNAFEAGKNPAWLGNGKLILSACVIWGFPWVGSFAILTYLAKLQGIDRHIYEAAEIDGASWWSKFTRIELPLITSSIYLLLVFVIIDTLNDAGMIIALTGGYGGGPGGVVTVPALFMLRQAFLDQALGSACAVGIVLTIIVMSLQKFSTLVTTWDTLKTWQRLGVRAVAVAVGLLTVYQAGLPILGATLVLAALPYGWLTDPKAFGSMAAGRQMAIRFVAGLAGLLIGAWGSAGILCAVVETYVPDEFPGFRQGLPFAVPNVGAVAFFVIGVALLVLSVPWAAAVRRLRRGGRPEEEVDSDHRPGAMAAEQRAHRAFERATDPRRRFIRGLGRALASTAKHAVIWLVLAFAFLPMYLMLVVSFKTNTQFYQRAVRDHPAAAPGELGQIVEPRHAVGGQQHLHLHRRHQPDAHLRLGRGVLLRAAADAACRGSSGTPSSS